MVLVDVIVLECDRSAVVGVGVLAFDKIPDRRLCRKSSTCFCSCSFFRVDCSNRDFHSSNKGDDRGYVSAFA